MTHRIPIHRFEITALAGAASVVGLLAACGIPPSARSALGTLRTTVTLAPLAFLLGLAAQAAWCVATRESPRAYLRHVLRRNWLVLWLRLWLACMVTSYAYFSLKAAVPLLNERSFDPALWRIDRVVHLGFAPSVLAIRALPASGVVTFLDYFYGLWLVSLVAGIAFFAASTDATLRRGFVHSCLLLWSFGALVYLALPAVGPAYAFPEEWSELRESMPLAAATQEILWRNYQTILASRARALPPFDHTLGVAALPSLHVAFHGLFALWAWAAARNLLPLFAAMTVATLVGSVRSGWHYAVDGYLGLALAGLAFLLARHMEGAEGASRGSRARSVRKLGRAQRPRKP